MTMSDPPDPARLLLIWTSPAFPIGAFAYSHGLEAAAAGGLVRTRADLESWLRDLIGHGSLRNDAILLAASWRAARTPDLAALRSINDLALALQPSAERHLETSQQGASFAATIAAAYPCAIIGQIGAQIEAQNEAQHEAQNEAWPSIALPVAFGAAAAGHAIPRADAVYASALGTIQNLVSAAIRLSIVGQTDGQRIVAALMPDLDSLRASALTLSLDDIGSATLSSDLASLEHETLYSRLFRS